MGREYDVMFRYMRAGHRQFIASLAAWGWPSFLADYVKAVGEVAQAWGRVADLVLAELEVEAAS